MRRVPAWAGSQSLSMQVFRLPSEQQQNAKTRAHKSRLSNLQPMLFVLSPRMEGVRSNGSWRRFTMVGISVVTFSPGHPQGCWKN